MPPKLGAPTPSKEGNWFMRLPTWAKWAIGIVSAVILLAVGAAIGSSEEDDLKDEVASVKEERNNARSAQEVAETELADLESEHDLIIAKAEDEAEEIVGGAQTEARTLRGSVQKAKGELSAARGELSEVEGELGGAEERVAKSKIGDGVWKLEVDYVAGTYEAEGGPYCYWEKLSDPSGEFDSIITNENGESRQLLTIDSPYFSTNGCGTWTLVE